MADAKTRPFSPRRLAVALAVQAACVALDVALSGGALTITGAVLLVPLALTAIGDEREVAVTGAVAVAAAIGSGWWNESVSTSQQVFRIAFFAVFAVLAVLVARSRERATALARRNETLATELDATRARLDGMLGSLGEAVTVHDERGKTIYANEAAAELLGCANVEEVLNTEPGELAARFSITREDGAPVRVEDLPGRRLMAGEDAPSLLTRSVRRDSGEAFWLLTKSTLYRDPAGAKLAINVIEDVTDAKEAELRQRFLAEAGQLLASSLDCQQTLERVARMIVPDLADWCVIDMLDEHGELENVAVAHIDPAKVEMAHDLRERYPPDMESPTGVPAMCAAGRPSCTARSPRSCSWRRPGTRSTCG